MNINRHRIQVTISGSGNNTFIYIINKEVLQLLLANSRSKDPIHPLEILEDNEVIGENICYGINVIDNIPSINIDIDGNSIQLDGLLDASDFEDGDYQDKVITENNLLYCAENVSNLKGDIPEEMAAVVVNEKCKGADAIAEFEIDSLFDMNNIRLNLIDLDTSSDYSEATYHLGLLEGMEMNLKSIIYGTKEFAFLVSNEDIVNQEIYIVQKNADGEFISRRL
jgi:hypothetical protein